MASAKAKIRHVFGDTFSCRAAPPDILVELSGKALVNAGHVTAKYSQILGVFLHTLNLPLRIRGARETTISRKLVENTK